jgi:hypothetical protein
MEPEEENNTTEQPLVAEIPAVAVRTPAQIKFYSSEKCSEAREALQRLVDSESYNTDSSYFSGNDNAFVERHLHYLSNHPLINVAGYISNLRLMTSLNRK